MGLEPTAFGTTIRRSNQLSYTHRELLENLVTRLLAVNGRRHETLHNIHLGLGCEALNS